MAHICLLAIFLHLSTFSAFTNIYIYIYIYIHFNKALLREELENFGRKLRLKWFFRNDERQFNINPFKQKSKFNPGKNDAEIKKNKKIKIKNLFNTANYEYSRSNREKLLSPF